MKTTALLGQVLLLPPGISVKRAHSTFSPFSKAFASILRTWLGMPNVVQCSGAGNYFHCFNMSLFCFCFNINPFLPDEEELLRSKRLYWPLEKETHCQGSFEKTMMMVQMWAREFKIAFDNNPKQRVKHSRCLYFKMENNAQKFKADLHLLCKWNCVRLKMLAITVGINFCS